MLIIRSLFDVIKVNKDAKFVNKRNCSKSLIKSENSVRFFENFFVLHMFDRCSIFFNYFFKNCFESLNKIHKNAFFQLMKKVHHHDNMYINMRKISCEISNIVNVFFIDLFNHTLILFIYLCFNIFVSSNFSFFHNILSTIRWHRVN